MRTGAIVSLMAMVQVAMAQVSPHGELKIPCETCHETDSWRMKTEPTFKHETTGFLLTGQHKVIKCASCHRDLKFSDTRMTCTSCHTDVHRSELGTNCLGCHTAESWRVPDMMQRHQQTRFPLAGRHLTAQCQSCHDNASQQHYVGTPTTCIGCHRREFETTSNPEHSAAGFSTDCSQCHLLTALTWDASFDHSLTAFPLTGAHVAAPCVVCHPGNRFTSLPAECVACHRIEYQQTSNPNHVAATFPTTCQTCHTTSTWRGATYDHSVTRFQLTGTHATTPCQSCHTNGNYQLVFNDCYQCHEAEFQLSANPNHTVANFPHDCRPCHSTSAWRPSTFNHDQRNFRIYTGRHRRTWTACSDCHLNTANFTTFTCLNCHEHHQSAMDPAHANVRGYSYASSACYNCHRGV